MQCCCTFFPNKCKIKPHKGFRRNGLLEKINLKKLKVCKKNHIEQTIPVHSLNLNSRHILIFSA